MSKVDLTKKRDKELIPLAREIILAIAARDDLVMGTAGTITNEQAAKYYRDKVIKVVLPIMIKKDIKIKDIEYLFQLVTQPFGFIREITLASFDSNRKIADTLMYGVKDIDDLKISELDNKLKAFAKKKK